jgi:hypothetical protein
MDGCNMKDCVTVLDEKNEIVLFTIILSFFFYHFLMSENNSTTSTVIPYYGSRVPKQSIVETDRVIFQMMDDVKNTILKEEGKTHIHLYMKLNLN